MRSILFKQSIVPLSLTLGQRMIVCAYLLASGSAVLLSQILLSEFHSPVDPFWFGLTTSIGAAVALFLSLSWFGGSGVRGTVRAFAGAGLLTALTFMFSVAFSLPVTWHVFGALVLEMLRVDLIFFGVAWAAVILMLHIMCSVHHVERLSIFSTQLYEPAPLHQFSVLSRLALPATLAHQRSRWIGN